MFRVADRFAVVDENDKELCFLDNLDMALRMAQELNGMPGSIDVTEIDGRLVATPIDQPSALEV